MLILNYADVNLALPMKEAIVAVRRAYAAWSSGFAIMPSRLHFELPASSSTCLVMPAYLPGEGGAETPPALAIKVVSVVPGNSVRGMPTIQGAVLVIDPESGECLALMDGAALTAIRTGAGSGVATDLLARDESTTLAVFGTGAQAIPQVLGVCSVRPIDTLWICARNAANGERIAAELSRLPELPLRVHVTSDPRTALHNADVVCTATTAVEPLFEHDALKAGTHINAIGAFNPNMREIPALTVASSRLFVDSHSAALKEAGDIFRAIAEGAIGRDHIIGEIGRVVSGQLTGRQTLEQITLFKSVGMAVQDAASASLALERANSLGIGQQVMW